MEKEILKQIWDNLTPCQQAACLKQAEIGECDTPKEVAPQTWKAITHYLKNCRLARVAHIEGGECEAIELTDTGKALSLLIAKRLEAELLPAADEGNQPPASQEPRALELPSELDTEQARKYFARAIAAGYMKVTATGGKWLMKPDKSLGYFCGKVYKESKPQTALARYFHVPNIGALITQTGPGYEVTRADAKRWRAKIDKEIFFD